MLINLRNALMTGKRLPYDAEVEYLESSGTQYIDTPVVWNPFTTKVTATFSTTITGTQYIFGSYGSAHNFIGTRNASGSMQILPAAGLMSTFGDIHTVTAYNASRTYYEILDGTGATISNANSNTTNTLSIFRINGVTTNIFNGRIYRLYLTDIATGQITADYIPVRKGTVGYLYDRVSGKLFGNEGSGDFTLGPDVVPVEYLDNNGLTQFIDTSVLIDAGTSIEADFTPMQMANDTWALGSFDANARRYAIYQYRSSTGGGYLGGGYGAYFSGDDATAITIGERMSVTVDFTATSQILKINGVQVASYLATNNSGAVTRTAYLFGLHRADSNILSFRCRFGNVRIWQNESLVRDFHPVRVGTDATSWEGAMMDVLTRRIYRNAGTGAFTYGNDLKYPIPAS